MSEQYVGEIRIVGFSFAPESWAFCDGSPMAISQNDVLFALLGTTYGGDGQETFNLPDLRSRFPLHMGQGPGTSNRTIGEGSGVEGVTLTTSQLPAHTHRLLANNSASNSASPSGKFPAPAAGMASYTDLSAQTGTLSNSTMGSAGGSQPHNNIPPYSVVNFIICLFGIFPSQN
jgi:microcystin-dependent protein